MLLQCCIENNNLSDHRLFSFCCHIVTLYMALVERIGLLESVAFIPEPFMFVSFGVHCTAVFSAALHVR